MKKKVLLFGLFFLGCLWATAQHKIEIAPRSPQKIDTRLRDKISNEFLLNLPITLSITDKNVLILMIGNDVPQDNGLSVWLFSKDMDLDELLKKDRNVNAAKAFKNQNKILNKVLPYHEKMKLYRAFEDGYEVVKQNAKPLLFEISNFLFKESLIFSL